MFQRRQAGHCPSHFGLDCPHSAQTKTVLCFPAGRDIAVPIGPHGSDTGRARPDPVERPRAPPFEVEEKEPGGTPFRVPPGASGSPARGGVPGGSPACVGFPEGGNMLWTITVILLVLWALGMLSGSTLGAWVHILLVLAVISLIFAVIGRGRATI